MASVAIRDVRKAFGVAAVIHGVDISIKDGEFVVLVGPSGCGKSTLLRMIAGLENITAGEIRIGDRVVNHLPPKERDVAMVFQNYALYPHMTVAANMAFSMKLRGATKSEIDERVNRAAAILGLSHLLGRFPRQLSGGQRQRLKTTTIYVTHDQIEAMTMADKIVVMHDGRVEQIGAPLELYDRPDNLFVAGFIGSPAMNMIKGRISVNGSAAFEAPAGVTFSLSNAPTGSDGRPAIYGVRPEHFSLSDDGADAVVQVVEPTGSELQVVAKLGDNEIS